MIWIKQEVCDCPFSVLAMKEVESRSLNINATLCLPLFKVKCLHPKKWNKEGPSWGLLFFNLQSYRESNQLLCLDGNEKESIINKSLLHPHIRSPRRWLCWMSAHCTDQKKKLQLDLPKNPFFYRAKWIPTVSSRLNLFPDISSYLCSAPLTLTQ